MLEFLDPFLNGTNWLIGGGVSSGLSLAMIVGRWLLRSHNRAWVMLIYIYGGFHAGLAASGNNATLSVERDDKAVVWLRENGYIDFDKDKPTLTNRGIAKALELLERGVV